MFATWAAAAVLLLAGSQARAVIINIGNATAAAGETVSIDVTLTTQGSMVAGTQNDITGTSAARIAADSSNHPACTPNAAINKNGTSFAFQPPGCTGAACTGIRALVLALNNVDPIPDGSVLYSCMVAVAGDASGDQTLTNSNEGASDPQGAALTTTGTNGTITVGAPPGGTTIRIGDASGAAGDFVSVDVTLDTEESIAGTQNDIGFMPSAAIAADEHGRPMCTANPDIMKNGTSFAFQPPSCTVGTTCTGVRALVLALNNVDPIPSGSVLYSCQIAIAENATGNVPLTCSNAGASNPAGGAVHADCTDGTIMVGGGTPAATATNTGGAATPTPTRAVTGGATGTPTRTGGTPGGTATRTNTPGGGPIVVFPSDDDACAITSPANSSSGWMVLLPVAALLWIRRRSR